MNIVNTFVELYQQAQPCVTWELDEPALHIVGHLKDANGCYLLQPRILTGNAPTAWTLYGADVIKIKEHNGVSPLFQLVYTHDDGTRIITDFSHILKP